MLVVMLLLRFTLCVCFEEKNTSVVQVFEYVNSLRLRGINRDNDI